MPPKPAVKPVSVATAIRKIAVKSNIVQVVVINKLK
jgi:hypothetical protein